jgi:tetratricopeptide (TPR) repeat protein
MNTAQIKKQLNKMLKDDKNIDFQDQIYFALGKIYLKERNEEEAIKAFRKSAQTSVSNQQQKAVSYLELANIFYERQKYLPAQNYYDSCLAFLDQQYPNYNEIANKSKNLNELAVHLITIIEEDSLQRVASMPERDRNKIIDKIIQDIIAEEERQKQEEQQQQLNSMMYMQNQMTQQNQQQAGKWYFYNPGTVSYGMGEFRRKWGSRKLEDNWRRKNKAVVAIVTDDEELAAIDSVQKKANDKKSRDYYLQGLPLTDSLMAVSHKRIEEALFSSGEIYMNLFRNYNHSIESFEKLNTRYPETQYQLISWYDLYRLNLFINNNERAEYYKQLIIQKHPGTNYANMLSNPNYLKEIEEKQAIINELYEQAYMGFKRNRFNSVFGNYKKADSLMASNPVMTKFSLLKALSYGGIGNLQEMKKELHNVIEKYPGTEEKTQAETILAMIEKGDYSYLAYRASQYEQPARTDTSQSQQQVVQVVEKEEADLYKINEEEPHVFALVYPYKVINYDQLRFNLFSFNTEYFIMFDFEVQNVRLDDSYSIITIRSFPGKREATRYYKSAAKHREMITRKLDDRHIQYFVIPESLLKEVSESKEFDAYIKFFEKKYLQKKSK